MDMNGNKVGAIFRTNKITCNENYSGLQLEAIADTYCWHSHFKISDWSKFKEPAIRITMHDDDISKSAQLQLVYTDDLWQDGKDHAWKYGSCRISMAGKKC